MALSNYFFIDGSTLTAQMRRLRRLDRSFENRKLDPCLFIDHLRGILGEFGDGTYKRATFYFPKGDEVSVDEYLAVPNFNQPGLVRDLYFKYCGEKLKGSTEFNEFVSAQVPERWQNRFSKSEKGIDIEICCDALKLAARSRLDRLFLFTNDDDFAPLCRTLKEFGANVSLIHLADAITPNSSLLAEADSYNVLTSDVLQRVFVPALDPNAVSVIQAQTLLLEPEKADLESGKADTEIMESDAKHDETLAEPKKSSPDKN